MMEDQRVDRLEQRGYQGGPRGQGGPRPRFSRGGRGGGRPGGRGGGPKNNKHDGNQQVQNTVTESSA